MNTDQLQVAGASALIGGGTWGMTAMEVQQTLGLVGGGLTLLAGLLWLYSVIRRTKHDANVAKKQVEAYEKQADYFEAKAKKEGLDV